MGAQWRAAGGQNSGVARQRAPYGAGMQTDRMRLRPWRRADAERLFDIRRRPEIAEWLADPEPWTDIAQATAAIESWTRTAADDPPCGTWAIEPTGDSPVAGYVSLHRLPDGEIDIGWTLHPDSVGQGWATEGAAALLERAQDAGVPRVYAVMWPNNLASAAVAGAIGMADLGVLVDPWYGTEEFPDSRIFVWPPPPR